MLVVNFWATWCLPCRAEIPDFIEFADRHDTNRVVIIGASVDEGGPKVVAPFVEAYKIRYPVGMADELISPCRRSSAALPAFRRPL